MQANTQQTKGWHVANWGFWGWLETAVKAVGIAAGILALITALPVNGFIISGNPRLAAVVVAGLATLFMVLVIVFRLQSREITSVIFAIFNAIGHIGILLLLLRLPDQRVLPLIFGVALIIGEIVRQRFFVVTGFTEQGQTTQSMVMLSRVIMGIYGFFVVCLLV